MKVKYFLLQKSVHITLMDKRRLQRPHSHPISLCGAQRRDRRGTEAGMGDPICPHLVSSAQSEGQLPPGLHSRSPPPDLVSSLSPSPQHTVLTVDTPCAVPGAGAHLGTGPLHSSRPCLCAPRT